MISQLEKDLRIERRRLLNEAIKKYGIKTSALSFQTGISDGNISNYKTGASEITEENWGKLQKGIETISNELPVKPNVEVEDWDYVIQQLNLHRNVWINKSKVKNIKQYIADLKLNGFDCTYTTDNDGSYIITNDVKQKPMVEKVIQPKNDFKPTVDIISKVHKMHEDALVLHEEALKVQASTEQLVKGLDEFAPATQEDVDKIVPGMREGMAEFNEMLNELFPEPVEEILITDEDIKEAVESKKACYQPSEEQKEELKELAEEVMSNLGIEKGIHTVDFVEFLETRMPKQEVRGYLRGKAIECLFEEDYHSAVICIEYFLDNGYVEVEA